MRLSLRRDRLATLVFIGLYLLIFVLHVLSWLPQAYRVTAGMSAFFVLAPLGAWVLRDQLAHGWRLTRARPWRTLGVLVAGLVGSAVASTLGALLAQGLEQVLGAQAPLANDERIGAVLATLPLPLLVAALAVAGPVLEELVFRGFLLTALARRWPTWLAVVVSGVAFGAIHLSSFSLAELLGVLPHIGFGIAAGVLYRWSGNLWLPITVHVLGNLSAVLGSA